MRFLLAWLPRPHRIRRWTGLTGALIAAAFLTASCEIAHRGPAAPPAPQRKDAQPAAATATATGPASAAGYAFPVKVGDVFDLAQGRALTPAELAPRLATARIVFVGEAHDEISSRRFQLQVIESLLAQGRDVFVALEMFPPSANEALAEWSRGNLNEKEFLERSGWYEHWGFAWSLYRELFLALRDKRLPARGINVTRDQRRLGGEGKLDPALREELGELDLDVEPHRRYLSDALNESGHPGNTAYDSPEFLRYLRIQVLWDHAMGVRAARLLQAGSSRAVVVVLIGSGHLEYGLGANLRAARARPDAVQLTLLDRFVPASDVGADGHTRVPVGLADVVRVDRYSELSTKPGSLSQVKLSSGPGGIKVESIRAFSESSVAALKPGDLIQSLNGRAYTDPIELRLAYEQIPPSGTAEWTLMRDGKTVRDTVPIHSKR